jgi:signal transduction histidine kinase
LLGILEITDEENPEIKEATNRQDFVDNPQYRALKQFIIDQLSQLEEHRISLRTKAATKTKTELKFAYDDLVNITSVVRDIKNRVPNELKGSLELLEKQTRKIQIDVKKGVSAYHQLEKEQIQDKNLYLSLMSLQDYAVEIAHVVKTSIGKIKSSAEFFNRQFPNIDFNDQFKKSSKRIFNEMMKLDSVVNFLLSYARSNIDFKEINVKEMIENLFFDAYSHIFTEQKIKIDVDIKDVFKIVHNQKFLEDIFENLISNSIKALKNQNDKQIKCTGLVEDDKFVIYFSDNGIGIAEEDKHRVFNIYFTKTAEDGGAGIGLYIVKTRIESMKGTVEVIDNEFKPHGATFKIVLPFVNTQ